MKIKDILAEPKNMPPDFKSWKDQFRRYWKPKNRYDPSRQITTAEDIIKIYHELVIQDMLDGKQVGFWYHGQPYMAWSIRDFKGWGRRYIYRAKFRGHYYKPYVELAPGFAHKMGHYLIFMWFQYWLYLKLSVLVQRGRDYDPVPNPPDRYYNRRNKKFGGYDLERFTR